MQLEQIFGSIFSSSSTTTIGLSTFLLCIVVALVIGLLLALAYTFRTRYTKSFAVTLATLPAVVCMVIMMVNGNLGAGVAVAGTFSLVRFRSVPGTAREIGAIFLAMGTGLALGMGYLGYAALFAGIVSAVGILYSVSGFGGAKHAERTMKITIPEGLDYSGVFDDLFQSYTARWELVDVKTTNMGSLFKLTYALTLRDEAKEKQLIDDLRCRNGNLEISMTRQPAVAGEL